MALCSRASIRLIGPIWGLRIRTESKPCLKGRQTRSSLLRSDLDWPMWNDMSGRQLNELRISGNKRDEPKKIS